MSKDDDTTGDEEAEPEALKKLEDESPISMRDVELEPVSLHEIEMILAPGRAPPRLNKSPSTAPPPLNKDAPKKRLPSIPRRPVATPAKPKYQPDSDSGTLDLKELAREMAPEAPPPKRGSIPDAELANIGTGMLGASPPMSLEYPTETQAQSDSDPPPKAEEPKPRAPVKAPVKKKPAPTETVEEPAPPPSKRASSRPGTAAPAVAKAPSVPPRAEPREESGSKVWLMVLGGAALLGIGFFIGRQTSNPPAAPEPRNPVAATTTSTANEAVCAPVVSATATQAEPVLATTAPVSAEPTASAASAESSVTATTAALVPSSTTRPTTTTTTAATSATTTVAPVKSSAAPAATAPFDKAAANAALSGLVGSAAGCKQPGDPSGTATVTVTFAPSGRVTTSSVSGPPFQGTATGGCIARAFKAATVPAFNGDPTTVSKTVHIP